jgi:hypothetical protein
MQEWINTCKSIFVLQHINRIRDKNNIIISRDVGGKKAFDEVQHPL